MNLTLTREPADGLSVRGVLSPLGMATLENQQYLIPCGTYPLEVTYSPRFKRLMPLVSAVPSRSGIRFHPGTKPEHSRGCILVSRADEDRLRELIQKEKVTLKIVQL